MKRMMHVTTARFGRFRQGIHVARIHDTKLDAYQYGTENLIIKSYIFEHYPLLVWSYGALFDDSYTIAQDHTDVHSLIEVDLSAMSNIGVEQPLNDVTITGSPVTRNVATCAMSRTLPSLRMCAQSSW
jgi:hypothetical protein